MENPFNTNPFDVQSTDKLNELKNHYLKMELENKKLRDKIDESTEINQELVTDINKIQEENKILKKESFKIGEVTELLNGEVTVNVSTNNIEMILSFNENEHEIEIGDVVAFNDNNQIVNVFKDNFSSKILNMEVDTSPDVMYTDIGGLNNQIKEIREVIEYPIVKSDLIDEVGIDPPNGILLYGPPGTGKTIMAKAVANKTDSTFITINATELTSKYIGDGAKIIREVFNYARKNNPSIIFIDEIDAISSSRSKNNTGSSEINRTLVQLLTELDGFDESIGVIVIAATNRKDMIDSALLRPGRLDRLINIPRPDYEDKKEILKIHLKGVNIKNDVDVEEIASELGDVSGAEIESIITEAGMNAINRGDESISVNDFDSAILKVCNDKEEIHPAVY